MVVATDGGKGSSGIWVVMGSSCGFWVERMMLVTQACMSSSLGFPRPTLEVYLA